MNSDGTSKAGTLSHVGKAIEVYIGNTKDPTRSYEIPSTLSWPESWFYAFGAWFNGYPPNGVFPGMAREHNSNTAATTSHDAKICNEGTPDQRALGGFKRLTGHDQGYIWSSITFFSDLQHYSETTSTLTGESLTRDPKPTDFSNGRINTQVYPTYWIYLNGKKTSVQNQAPTPSALFPNTDKCQ